jgi:hypothetical protein
MRATFIALILASACGGTTASSDCTITLTGAVNDSITCSRVAAEYNGTTKQGGFGVTASSSASQFSLAIETSIPPNIGTILSSSGTPATISVGNGSQTWEAVVSTGAPTGSYDLTISDMGSATTIGGNTGWPQVHGMLNAILQPQGSASGTVTVQANF